MGRRPTGKDIRWPVNLGRSDYFIVEGMWIYVRCKGCDELLLWSSALFDIVEQNRLNRICRQCMKRSDYERGR